LHAPFYAMQEKAQKIACIGIYTFFFNKATAQKGL
jgi:hypothetical protein